MACLGQKTDKVAPYVGAWIETTPLQSPQAPYRGSHPMWVRGLKLNLDKIADTA